MTPADRRRFVIEHTTIGSALLVPEILLHIGGSSMALWEAAALADVRPAVPPPYWAWPRPGGQASDGSQEHAHRLLGPRSPEEERK
jgi:predicted nicotinamide N-methyase